MGSNFTHPRTPLGELKPISGGRFAAEERERGRRERGKEYWGRERGKEGKGRVEGGKGEGGGKERGEVCIIHVRGPG